MTKSENAPVEKRPTAVTPAESKAALKDPISARDGRDVGPRRPRNELEISACVRGEFEACLEKEQI